MVQIGRRGRCKGVQKEADLLGEEKIGKLGDAVGLPADAVPLGIVDLLQGEGNTLVCVIVGG